MTSTDLSVSSYIHIDKKLSDKMDCPICKDHITPEQGIHCASCASNLLYNLRLDLARGLLEKESLAKKAEAIVGPEPDPSQPLDEETARLRRAWQKQQANIEEQRVKEENEALERELMIKRKELEEKRARAQAMQENLTRRRANLAAVKLAEAKGQKKKWEELREASVKLKAQADAIHNRVVDTRAALCQETATLLKLQHTKKKMKDGTIKDRHLIAGLLLPDLKEINSEIVIPCWSEQC